MIDPRRSEALAAFLVERLVTRYRGWLEPTSDAIPPSVATVLVDDLIYYVTPDVGEPSTGRPPAPDTVLLSSCAAALVGDDGATQFAIHEFRDDPTVPDDLNVWTTRDENGIAQVWLDRLLPSTISEEVAIAMLHEFHVHATRLRTALAPLDMETSEEAAIRWSSGVHREPLSYEFIEGSEWHTYPWLSRLVRKTNIDLVRMTCLFDLSPSAAWEFASVELHYELADGTWKIEKAQIPGPYAMPAMDWQHPSVAWDDPTDWMPAAGDPKRPTGRVRAKVPTGWTGPPV